MKRTIISFVITLLVGLFNATHLPAESLTEFIGFNYTTMVSAADKADVVAWVARRRGEERLFVARGPEYRTQEVVALLGDTGDKIRSLTLSPDGRYLIFRRGPMPAPDGRMPNPASLTNPLVDGLWLADLLTDRTPQLLTLGGGSASFSPQSDRLAFIKSGKIHVTLVENPELPNPLFTDRGGLTEYAWSPDGKSIAFVSTRRTSGLLGLFGFGSDQLRWLAPSTGRDSNIAWSPDGKQIAFLRRPGSDYKKPFQVMKGDPFEVWSVEVATGSARLLHQDTRPNLFKQLGFPLRWLSDGRVLFLSEADGFSHLYAVGQNGGQPQQLTQGKFEVEDVIVDPSANTVAIGSNRSDVHRRDIAVMRQGTNRFQQISSPNTVATEPVFIGETARIAFRSADEQHAPTATLVAIDGSGQERALMESPRMSTYKLPESVTFDSTDGLKITGTLFRASGLTAGQPGSAVVYIHGGPPRQMMPALHRSIYYAYAYAANQYLAAQGITVLAINYRCGVGFGTDFHRVPNYGPHGAAEFQDIVAAGEYLRSLPTVDADRIGLYGGSYGGFLTAYGLARRSDLFAAGVAWHGVYDWSFWQRNPQPGTMFFTPWGVAEEDPDVVRDSSPIAHVDTWRSPVLLVSGDDDRRVLVEETVALERSLRDAGVAVETMIIPNEIHSFLRHQTWENVLRRTVNFLQSNLQG